MHDTIRQDWNERRGTPEQEALLKRLFHDPLSAEQKAKLDEDLRLPDDWEEGHFYSDDNLRLSYVFAHHANPKGLIVLLPGRAQSYHEYHEFVREMRTERYAVAAFDRRSQGKSEGRLPSSSDHHRTDYHLLKRDVNRFMRDVIDRSDYKDLPKILVGHSMGGADGLMHLSSHRDDFQAAAFLAPMWGLNINRLLRANQNRIFNTLERYNLIDGRSLFQPEWSLKLESGPYGKRKTNDPVGRALQPTLFTRHPELVTGVATWHFAKEALKTCRDIQFGTFIHHLPTPVLTILGEGDKIISNKAAERVTRTLPNGQLVVVGGTHQSLQESPEVRRKTYDHLKRFCNNAL